MKIVKVIGAVLLLAIVTPLVAQPPHGGGPDPDLAAEHFSHANYTMALPIYLELLKKEPDNYDYNYRTGICYLNTYGNKKEAIKYFEFCTKQPKCDNDVWLYLGQSYQIALRFDDAIKAFQTYQLKADKTGKALADHYIQQCESGKVLVKKPLDVTFQNLGKEVNSEFPDYYPFVTLDESMLVFTSRRKGNIGASSVEMDGYYSSDIWYSHAVNGVFQKAKNAGALVNGNFDEQCVGLSADGKWMTVYIDNISVAGDIYFSGYNRSFSKPVRLSDTINSDFETAGSLSPDGNIIFFASRRSGGHGGTDLYMCKKLPTGSWALPQNLGDEVNTEYDEDFPFMSSDGKTLYFSSQGHNSMGGFDLFATTYDEDNNTWSTPRNLGYPINTPEDERTISFTQDDRVAYISSDRAGGQGNLDIWRVVFNQVQANSFTVLTGKIILPDSTINKEDLLISVTLASTNEDYGSYKPNPNTGNYVMALPPGKYILTMDVPGCKQYIETVIVFDIGPQGAMTKDILLTKQ